MSDSCPLGEDCDLTAAYMAGHERGKDALHNRIAALEAENARLKRLADALVVTLPVIEKGVVCAMNYARDCGDDYFINTDEALRAINALKQERPE